MDARIIHATDFSAEADTAQDEAVRLARGLSAELILVHVATETPLYGETAFSIGDVQKIYAAQARWAEEELARRSGELTQSGVPTRWRRRVGAPHEEIVKAAGEERAAYIVIGTHGRSGLGRFMLGSVADRVVRSAPGPVVTVGSRRAGG